MGNKYSKYLSYTPNDARKGKISLKHACDMLTGHHVGRPDTIEEIYKFLKTKWDGSEYMYEFVESAIYAYESRNQDFVQSKIYTPRS